MIRFAVFLALGLTVVFGGNYASERCGEWIAGTSSTPAFESPSAARATLLILGMQLAIIAVQICVVIGLVVLVFSGRKHMTWEQYWAAHEKKKQAIRQTEQMMQVTGIKVNSQNTVVNFNPRLTATSGVRIELTVDMLQRLMKEAFEQGQHHERAMDKSREVLDSIFSKHLR